MNKPILFQGVMVPAILREPANDPKTQTRRKVKPPYGIVRHDNGQLLTVNGWLPELDNPYGAPGDKLWVKETHWRYGRWAKCGVTPKGKTRWKFVAYDHDLGVQFTAPAPPPKRGKLGWHKRPSIFLPRLASRILLEIVKVRAERLNDISEEDAVAEGCEMVDGFPKEQPDKSGIGMMGWDDAREWYSWLWEEINGPGSWDANDYVWVIEFKRIKP